MLIAAATLCLNTGKQETNSVPENFPSPDSKCLDTTDDFLNHPHHSTFGGQWAKAGPFIEATRAHRGGYVLVAWKDGVETASSAVIAQPLPFPCPSGQKGAVAERPEFIIQRDLVVNMKALGLTGDSKLTHVHSWELLYLQQGDAKFVEIP